MMPNVLAIMAGLVPAIHAFALQEREYRVPGQTSSDMVGTLAFGRPKAARLHRPDFDHVGDEVLEQVLDAVLERRGR
jgi:hypothetical protein